MEIIKETQFRRPTKIREKINMTQAKNIDQADKINQTIGSIVLSRSAMAIFEKNQGPANQKQQGSKKDKTTLGKLRRTLSVMAKDV